MIYSDRNTVAKPKILDSAYAMDAYKRMEDFFANQDGTSKYQRFRFNDKLYTDPEVENALKQLFHNKCAYCDNALLESYTNSQGYGVIDHFRPKTDAMNTDGSFDPLHYWWLAYEWKNLYPVCNTCQKYKRNNFPILGDQRADILGDVSTESTLLLDPCNPDDFLEAHIGYDREKAIPLTEKGANTIRVLGLNRKELIYQRQSALFQLENALKEGHYVHDLIIMGSPFLACKWANYKKELFKAKGNKYPDYLPYLGKYNIPDTIDGVVEEPIEWSQNIKKKPSRKSYSLDKFTSGAKSIYFGESRWITKVKIKNFKIIEDLELVFSDDNTVQVSGKSQQPWMAILGENGTGKSTVLQAITLALAGQERLDELGLDAHKFVNRNVSDTSGWVRVYLNDRNRPISLKFSKDKKAFSVSPKAPQLIVRSYGATRLFSKANNDTKDKDFIFIDNLFDPLHLLLNGNQWLLDKINDETLFPEIAKSLGDLLSLSESQYFYPDKDEDGQPIICLKLYPDKAGLPLDELSAGYKAILALGLDIMMGFGQIWPSIFNAQGVVLVDEIGVHLHPRWKMKIVKSLRNTFPGINFVIATHEPLCLRGLEQGEVTLMRLDDSKNIEIITDLPSPKTMRVGQLLTSVFGLYTTMDPDMEQLYSEFYQLQSLRQKDAEDSKRFEELKTLLKDELIVDPTTGDLKLKTVLGDNLGEVLHYGVIEKKVEAYKAGTTRPNLKAFKEDTLSEIQQLWKS